MMQIEDIELRSLLDGVKKSKTHYVADCPFCGKEKHFYINIRTQLWDCKHCGESGNIYKLLVQVGKTYLLQGKTVVETSTIKKIRDVDEETDTVPDITVKEIGMPAGWKVFDRGNDYLRSRGITNEEARRYRFGGTKLLSSLRNYVTVPIMDCNKTCGYISRYANKHIPDGVLRYNNSNGTDFAKLLFGYDDIIMDRTQTVIIVEGVFDKIAVDRVLRLWWCCEVKCVATFGKKISDTQIYKLTLKHVRNVVLLYDIDAIKEIRKYAEVLNGYFNTTVTFTQKKDIDECTEEEALQVFRHTQKPAEFNQNVITKLKR